MNHILILGGGASGIAASLQAAQTNPHAQITILEQLDRIGKKILATGNGRCNLGNQMILPECYHSQTPDRLAQLLSDMPASKTTDFFYRHGLLCTTDEAGRIYPYARQASMVVDILLLALQKNGIQLLCSSPVTRITRRKKHFCVVTQNGAEYHADSVIVTTGGKAAPKQGSTGSGYALAASFGHHCTKLQPALVPIQCRSNLLKRLKGIRVHAAVSLYIDGTKHASDRGELQLTDYGISGIPAMNLSGYLATHTGYDSAELRIDFFPDWDYHELRTLLSQRIHSRAEEPLDTLLSGTLPKRILASVYQSLSLSPTRSASSLSRRDLDALLSALKGWTLPVTGTLSWENAQVTGGGIPLTEIDDTFQSRFQPGLYLAGELLDAAGDCGGYNLHWAWCSGMAAGQAAASQNPI